MFRSVLPLFSVFLTISVTAFCQTSPEELLYDGQRAFDRYEYQKSDSLLSLCEALYEKTHPKIALKAGIFRARTLAFSGRFDESKLLFSSLGQQIERYPELETTYLAIRGSTFYFKGPMEQAKADLEAVIDKLRDPVDAEAYVAANAHLAYASLLDDLGAYQQASDLYENGLKIIRRDTVKNLRNLQSTLNNYGITLRKMGRYDEAIACFLQASEVMKILAPDNLEQIGTGYLNLASIHLSQQEIEPAIDMLENALGYYLEAFGPVHEYTSYIYNNIGICYFDLGRYQKALQYMQKSLQIKGQILPKDHPDLALALNNMATVYNILEDYDKARNLAEKSLVIRESLFPEGSPQFVVNYQTLASSAFGMKMFSMSAFYLEKAIQLLETNYSYLEKQQIQVFAQYVSVLIELGEWEKADRFLQRARAMNSLDSSQFEFRESRAALKLAFSEALLPYRNYQETKSEPRLLDASQLFKNNLDVVSSISRSANYTSSLLTNSQAFHEYASTATYVHLKCWNKTKDPKYFERALEASELAKSFVLHRQIQDRAAKGFSGVTDSELAKEKNLAAEIANLEADLAYYEEQGSAKKQETLETRTRLIEARTEHAELLRAWEQDYPKYYQLKYAMKSVVLNEVQQSLPPGAMLLHYNVSDSVGTLMWIGKDDFGANHFDADSLEDSINELLPTLINSGETFNENAARRLYSWLIPRQRVSEGVNQLVVIPEGPLTKLPFEVLITKESKYLVEELPLRYRLGLNEIRKTEQHSSEYLGFAPVVFDGLSDLSPMASRGTEMVSLPNTLREVREARNMLANTVNSWLAWLFGQRFEIFTYTEASKDVFLRETKGFTGIVHLATHSYLDPEEPDYSKIFFSRDSVAEEKSILYQSELFATDIPAGLVILSSCKSGGGAYVKGEGVLGLTNAFFYAGVHDLMVTLWNIRDDSSAELMTRFFKFYANGQTPEEAIANAKRSLLNSEQYSHPSHWSSFVLFD